MNKMLKIYDFVRKIANPFIWTGFYILTLYFILLLIFNFNLLSPYHWDVLSRARLHGFPGFCFGLIMFSAIPLYISTVYLVYKKNIFPVPIDFWNRIKIFQKPAPVAEPEKPKIEEPKQPDFDGKEIPNEMRARFLMMRGTLNQIILPEKKPEQSKTSEPEIPKNTEIIPEPEMPLDFDFNDVKSSDDIPNFSDMDFDDDFDIDENNVIDYLNEKDIRHIPIDDDVVLLEKYVLGWHDDSDFWVADDDTWFASGSTKMSPVEKILENANKFNLKPALYLGSKNIQDIETLQKSWEKSGVKIITDLSEIDTLSEE